MPDHPLADLSVLDSFITGGARPGQDPNSRLLYSPVDDVHGALVAVIGSARRSLVITMYGFDDEELADVIARTILAFQAHAEPGAIAVELNADIHTVVHQAAGMVSIQLVVSVGDALARLRAYAFGTNQSIAEVSRDIVSRRLNFSILEEP